MYSNLEENGAKWLIKNGADVNILDKDNQSALNIADRNSRLIERLREIAELLIEKGAHNTGLDLNTRKLLRVALTGDDITARMAIENGANVNATDFATSVPAIFLAIRHGMSLKS